MGFEITEEMVEAIVERKVEEAIDGSSVNFMIRDRINETVDKIVRDQVSGALELLQNRANHQRSGREEGQ